MTELKSSLVRFLLVGAGFSLGYSALVAFLVGPLGMPPFWTSTVIFAVCIPLAFHAHRQFSFNGGAVRKRGFLSYAVLQISCFAGVNLVLSRYVAGHFWKDSLLYLVTVGAAALLTFLAARLLVFTPSEKELPRSEGRARKPR